MTTTMLRLALTSDTALRSALRRKLVEYKERFARQVNDSALPYKIGILESLFEVGHVDIGALHKKFEKAFGAVNDADFSEALNIIAAYNDGQLARLAGGTGLQ